MTTFESFLPIPEFPGYMVGNKGQIYNTARATWPEYTKTQGGDPTVGLTRDGRQYRRSVKVLVAQVHVPGQSPEFNTPVQLDGDKDNLRADNIVWRPRWFSWRYAQQFNKPPEWAYAGPVFEQVSNSMFENILYAAMGMGYLISDIRRSIFDNVPAYPDGAIFSFR